MWLAIAFWFFEYRSMLLISVGAFLMFRLGFAVIFNKFSLNEI